MNHISLLANLTADPEIRYVNTSDGQSSVCTLRLANNTYRKGREDAVLFVDCATWGRTAENCAEHLVKGSRVLIDGTLRMESWRDKETGKQRQKISIVARQVHFLGSPNRDTKRAPEPDPQPAEPMGIASLPDDGSDDNIPF